MFRCIEKAFTVARNERERSRNSSAEMKQLHSIPSSLPYDVALKIASFLEDTEVCALGSSCKYWREICRSDFIWEARTRQRWPFLSLFDQSSPSVPEEGWKGFYMKRHNNIVDQLSAVVNNVEQRFLGDSLEAGEYLLALEDLSAMQLGFKDVQMLIFRPKLNVFINLLGLHYCILGLNVPPEYVMEALESSKISEREVCVKWWKLGRWFYGFRMRDESHSRWVSLADLAMAREKEVLGVLHRGAVHEVLRVQISVGEYS